MSCISPRAPRSISVLPNYANRVPDLIDTSSHCMRVLVSDTGYRTHTDTADGETFMIKSRQDTKQITLKIEDDKTGRIKTIKEDIDIKVVAHWSAKYARRTKRERERTLIKANTLISNPAAYNRATHYGAARYVKNITIDSDTGEILTESGKVAMLDNELIAAEAALDGYYVIITSETDMTDEDIVKAYRELWRIEDSFKITKSLIKLRPMYVSTKEHIKAHFLICYIGLVIMRLMQHATDFNISPEAIVGELKKMVGVHLADNWWRFSHRTDISDELCRVTGIDLTRKNMRLKEIKSVLAQINKK